MQYKIKDCTYKKNNKQEKLRKANKCTSVSGMTLLPNRFIPLGQLHQSPINEPHGIKHRNRLLHPLTQQQEQQVAYSIKQKIIRSNLVNIFVTTCNCYMFIKLKVFVLISCSLASFLSSVCLFKVLSQFY